MAQLSIRVASPAVCSPASCSTALKYHRGRAKEAGGGEEVKGRSLNQREFGLQRGKGMGGERMEDNIEMKKWS